MNLTVDIGFKSGFSDGCLTFKGTVDLRKDQLSGNPMIDAGLLGEAATVHGALSSSVLLMRAPHGSYAGKVVSSLGIEDELAKSGSDEVVALALVDMPNAHVTSRRLNIGNHQLKDVHLCVKERPEIGGDSYVYTGGNYVLTSRAEGFVEALDERSAMIFLRLPIKDIDRALQENDVMLIDLPAYEGIETMRLSIIFSQRNLLDIKSSLIGVSSH